MEDFFFLTVINFLMSVIGSDLGLILVSKRVLNSNLENFQQKKKKKRLDLLFPASERCTRLNVFLLVFH